MTDTSPTSTAPLAPPPTATEPSGANPPSRPATRRTRLSAAWVAVIVASLIVVLLLVFILQNTDSVEVSHFAAHGTMPLGVALLLAGLAGIFIAALIASLRIWQLHHRLNHADH
jgi:lipopolysaccharide assembly protein A